MDPYIGVACVVGFALLLILWEIGSYLATPSSKEMLAAEKAMDQWEEYGPCTGTCYSTCDGACSNVYLRELGDGHAKRD